MAMETAEQTEYVFDDMMSDIRPLTGGELDGVPIPDIVMGSALESRYLTTGLAGLASIALGSFF